eukprot:COSAG01_NODE_33007_length_571_cov_2.786017_2_plen_130_part_00
MNWWQVILKRNPRAIKDGVIGEVNRFLSQVLGSKFAVRVLVRLFISLSSSLSVVASSAGRIWLFVRLRLHLFFRILALFVTVVVGWLCAAEGPRASWNPQDTVGAAEEHARKHGIDPRDLFLWVDEFSL